MLEDDAVVLSASESRALLPISIRLLRESSPVCPEDCRTLPIRAISSDEASVTY